jgi:hypothetical protein
MDPVLNFAKVTVSTGYDNDDVTIVLASGHGAKLPAPATDGAFNLVWWNSTDYTDPSDDPNVEIVRCTARTTDTLTVTRGQEGTSGSNKNTGDKVYKMILTPTKKTIDDIATGPLETKTDDYTVTLADRNKTLVMNVATNAKTFSFPSVAATNVGLRYTFAKINTGKLTIDAADSDKIADSGAGDGIYNDQTLEVYASITLELISETQWVIVGADGIWVTTD